MRIYTRGGDAGETALFGGERVAKDAVRVEAYGAIDEANAVLGWVVAALPEQRGAQAHALCQIQAELFDIGAELATPEGSPHRDRNTLLGTDAVRRLEAEIDRAAAAAPPLRHFVLPGGTELAARLHVARTVVRRAERRMVTLHEQAPLRPVLLQYMNRLSDLLFVWAREANAAAQVEDVPYRA